MKIELCAATAPLITIVNSLYFLFKYYLISISPVMPTLISYLHWSFLLVINRAHSVLEEVNKIQSRKCVNPCSTLPRSTP